METSEEVAAGASGDQLEEGPDGKPEKKRKFKPFEAMRKFFRSSRKRLKGKEEDGVVGLKAKSTSELVADRAEEDSDDGGFKRMSQARSISEDSIFNPDQKEQARVSQFTKGAKSAENVNQNFKSELATKLKKRQSFHSDDDGLPKSPASSFNAADSIMAGLKASSAKSASRESDKSLLSVGSLEHEEDPFQTNWKASVASVVTRRSKTSSNTESTMDFDLSAVQPTTALKSEAAKHRISVAPKARRAGKQGKRSTPSMLPEVKEESPAKTLPAPTPVEPKQSAKPARVPAKTDVVKSEGKRQLEDHKAGTEKLVDSKLSDEKSTEGYVSVLPLAKKIKIPTDKEETEKKQPDTKIGSQKLETSQDSDKENSIEVATKLPQKERSVSVNKSIGVKEHTLQNSTTVSQKADVGKLPLRPTLSDPLDKAPKVPNPTVLAKASSLTREQAKPPDPSDLAEKPFSKPPDPSDLAEKPSSKPPDLSGRAEKTSKGMKTETSGAVVEDLADSPTKKKDVSTESVSKARAESELAPLSPPASSVSDKVLTSPTKATPPNESDKSPIQVPGKGSVSDSPSATKQDSESDSPGKVSSLAAGFGKVSASTFSGAINGSSVSSKSAVNNYTKPKPLQKQSVSVESQKESDMVRESGATLAEVSQESSKPDVEKTEMTVPQVTVKLPASAAKVSVSKPSMTTPVSDSKPADVISAGLVPSDKSADSAQLHRLASPKEEYKMKRQGRSKTLPDSKEQIGGSVSPPRNDYDNVIFSRMKPQVSESSKPEVTKSSQETDTDKKAGKSSPVTSPARHTNTVITPAAKRPEPKRLSLVSGLVSDSSEPIWVAMARKKSSEESTKDEKPNTGAPQPASKPSRTPSEKSITKSASVNATSSSPVSGAKVSPAGETEASQKPADQKTAAKTAAEDTKSVAEKTSSAVPTNKPIRFIRTMASKPTPVADKPPTGKSFIIEKPALTSSLPEKTKPDTVTGSAKTSQQKSFTIEKPPMTSGVSSKTEAPTTDGKTTTVPAWRNNLQKRKDPADVKIPEIKKIEIIDKPMPVSTQKTDSIKVAPKFKSEPSPVVLREKTQQEKCVDVSARSSKVLDMVKNFQKLQVS